MPFHMLLSIIVTALILTINEIILGQPSDVFLPRPFRSEAIGPHPPKDKYNEIRGTVFWEPYCGVSEDIFDEIERRLSFRITEARNVYFEYTRQQNLARRRQACKISNRNRILNFLRQLKTGQIEWDAVFEHGWNRWSVRVDFLHVLWHFVDEFDADTICKMDAATIAGMQGTLPQYPRCYQLLDGCQFKCLRSGTLPPGTRRRDYYCWKGMISQTFRR